jgi:hypothetical protein
MSNERQVYETGGGTHVNMLHKLPTYTPIRGRSPRISISVTNEMISIVL